MEYVTIKLNPTEYNLIIGGLAKLPYETSAQLIANLSEQVKIQVAESEQKQVKGPE